MPRRIDNSVIPVRSRYEKSKRKFNLRISAIIFKRRRARIESSINLYTPWLGYFADNEKTHIRKPRCRLQKSRKKSTNRLVRRMNLSVKGAKYKKLKKYEYGKVW